MAKIVFLGTAASISTKERDNTSFIFSLSKNKNILIDCPGCPVKKIKERGLNYKTINDIIITHNHVDHIYGIPSLIHSFFKIKKTVNIYSSGPSIRLIKNLIKQFRLNREHYPQIRYVNVFKNKPFLNKKNVKIQSFKNNHVKGSFGINILYKNKNIVYSSDTAPTKRIETLTNPKTYLIHDCTGSAFLFKKFPSLYKMHTESSQLKEIILNNLPKLTIPVHFLLLNKQVLKQIKKDLSGLKDICIPGDYTVIDIK